ELLDEHGLADAGAAEEPGLAALRIRLQEVDDLDARLEHLDLRRLVLERRGRPMDRVHLLRVDRRPLVHGLADDVQDPAERPGPDRDPDPRAGVAPGPPAPESG